MEMPQKQMDVVWKPGMVWRDPKPKGETKIYPPWKSIEEKVIEGIGLNSTESQPGLGWRDPKNHPPAPQGAPRPVQTQPQQLQPGRIGSRLSNIAKAVLTSSETSLEKGEFLGMEKSQFHPQPPRHPGQRHKAEPGGSLQQIPDLERFSINVSISAPFPPSAGAGICPISRFHQSPLLLH